MLKHFVILLTCAFMLAGCFGSSRMMERDSLYKMTTDQKVDYLINQNNKLRQQVDDNDDDLFMAKHFPRMFWGR